MGRKYCWSACAPPRPPNGRCASRRSTRRLGFAPSCLAPRDGGHRVCGAVAAFLAFQDHIVAGLQREVEMRHQPRLAGDQLIESVVNLDAVERRQAQGLKARLSREQPPAEVPEAALI